MNLKDFKLKLDDKINSNEQVFLVPHLGADFDAIASCVAMALIVKKIGKPVYIIFDENPLKIEPGVKIIIEEVRKIVNIITLDKYKCLSSNKDLLIALDVNKANSVCCEKELSNFNDIVIIDHHKESDQTMVSDCKFIDINLSSVSEVLAELLLLYKVRFDSRIADYLLAGIYLDTNKFVKATAKSKTMGIVSKLMENGGDLSRVNEFFEEDFWSDRKVQELVNKVDFFTYTIAICIANDDVVYTKEELAKVADYLLQFKADAAFAAGYIDENLISVSARSKGKVDVGEVMKDLDGGGNLYSAATKICNQDIGQVSKSLVRRLTPNYYCSRLNSDDEKK